MDSDGNVRVSGRWMMKTVGMRGIVLVAGLLCAVLWAAPAGAVDKGQTSYTAEVVCALRSIGALDPDPKTRNPDHMAKAFVNKDLYARFPGLGLDWEDATLALDRMNNGILYYINARTLHMDGMLAQALQDGVRQVVILGAGFDSRAYRFHERYPTARFFEIDLPATSRDKQQRVEKILGRRPEWVAYVDIDFNTQTLEEVLGRAGFASDQKTFYVWEGVTYFISEAGVDGTLRFIAAHSAPGSRVVFDYMLQKVVMGHDYSAYGARRTVRSVARRGEPYVFGITPDHLETFVNRRGLALLSDLGPDDLTRRYLIRSNGETSGRISEFLRIVLAEVSTPGRQKRLREKAEAALARAGGPSPAGHAAVKVPEEVQVFFSDYSRCLLESDYPRLADFFSSRYLDHGHTREAVMAFLKRAYGRRPLHEHRIVLTRFDQKGERAYIDGYVSRKGYRTPLMVHDIIKEADGRWRWFGNQQ